MSTTPAATWTATLGQLELLVTRANYDTWLRDTIGLRHDGDRFTVGVTNDFARDWLGTRMRPLIAKTIAEVLGGPTDVTFEVLVEHAPAAPALSQDTADVVPEMYRRAAPPPTLHPALTFDAFVTGDENRIAFDAAKNAALHPGTMSPLVLFGPPGMGKTHLLNAVGHVAHGGALRVVYATAERFGNEYVEALSKGELERFRAKYRTCDVLLLDDCQFFEGKPKFAEEFFHTFNDLHAGNRQIVVSLGCAPSRLDVSDALRSRFGWGLAADLQRPSFEMRLAILRAKAMQHATRLPEDALRLIAEKCCPSVRELEGYLNRVLVRVPMFGGRVTADLIEKALHPFGAPVAEAAPPSADAVVAAVCRRTGVQPADLRGASRSRDIAYARHLAIYLLREDAHESVAAIGRMFGNRDHATVIAGATRIKKELKSRPETRADVDAVREDLRAAPAPAERMVPAAASLVVAMAG